MKWPTSITVVRHGESSYNILKKQKEADPEYQAFKEAFEGNPDAPETRVLALRMKERFALNVSDYETPLTPQGIAQAEATGRALGAIASTPDVIYISPYLRTHQTFECMERTWPALQTVDRVYLEERIREQEHGLITVYNDYRVFQTLNPQERQSRALAGSYYYRYPGGENVPDVRERVHSWLGTLVREFSNARVLVVTHHLAILSLRATLERLSPDEFIHLDETEKPINCGVTLYEGDSQQGKDGKLVLRYYNKRLYP